MRQPENKMAKTPKNPGFELYKKRFKTECANFEKDRQLKKVEKDRFRNHWRSLGSKDPEAFAKEFFHDPKSQQLGSEQILRKNEVLGHVRTLKSLARHLSENYRRSFNYDLDGAQNRLRELTLCSAAVLRQYFQRTFRAREAVSLYMMWSFRNPKVPHDPFSGIDLGGLPCRLGLPSFGVPEHVGFGHARREKCKYKKPTAFDAGLGEQWVVGGFTKPLPPCAGKYPKGLPEVVHDAAHFTSIVTELKMIKK